MREELVAASEKDGLREACLHAMPLGLVGGLITWPKAAVCDLIRKDFRVLATTFLHYCRVERAPLPGPVDGARRGLTGKEMMSKEQIAALRKLELQDACALHVSLGACSQQPHPSRATEPGRG